MTLHPFRPRLLADLKGYRREDFLADLSAGLTVGIVALPLAMAFAIASGLKPEQGLVTAIVAGFLISALGGSSVQIGGPAGAFIVIVYGILQRHGLTNLLIATALAGVLLVVMGALKLGALVRYLPTPIITGFTNGIAVLIGLSQLKDLLGLDIARMPADFFAQLGALGARLHTLNPVALAIGLACLLLVVAWPKSYAMPTDDIGWRHRVHRAAAHVPGTIVALALATVAKRAFELPVETIGSRFGGIPQALPALALPPFSWDSAQQLVIPTLTIALLGAIESLLCARVADNIADRPRHDPNQELMAQGVANLVAPLFGGLPATGTIARTVTNVRSGARTPVAGIVHALALLAIVLLAAPLAADVPLAALAGLLLFVAWNMGEWREFALLGRFGRGYAAKLLGTFVMTVVFDLTVAVQVGLLIAFVVFLVRMAQLFRVEAIEAPAGVRAWALRGPLFFGAVARIDALAAQLDDHTRAVVLDASALLSIDNSGLDALEQLQRQLQRRGIALWIAAAPEEPRRLMQRAEFDALLAPGGLAASVDEAFARCAASAASGPR